MSAVAATPKVVSQQEWMAAHKEHLSKEKLLTRLRDDLSRERRELPWMKVEKNYIFDGPNGEETLADLFDDRSQLIVYHFMLGPGWEQGFPSCSLIADHVNPSVIHLAQRDVSFAAISRAPWPEIAPFRKRMGWSFKWVSSYRNDFNRDYHVSFTAEERAAGCPSYNFDTGRFPMDEGPGFSVFYRNENGEIFRTFSAFGRGGEPMLGVYNLLDLVPKGRDEEGLSFPMAWVRHHDRYAEAQRKQSCCAHDRELQ